MKATPGKTQEPFERLHTGEGPRQPSSLLPELIGRGHSPLDLPRSLRPLREIWVFRYGVVAAALIALSVVLDLLTSGVYTGNLAMAYLLAVLFVAVVLGKGPAVFAAVGSYLCLSWFFAEPIYNLLVANSGEWLLLITFLVVAVVTGQLAGVLRQNAVEARQREREAMILGEIMRQMLETDLAGMVSALAERLRDELALAAVVISIAESPIVQASGESGDATALAVLTGRMPGKAVPSTTGSQYAALMTAVVRWLRAAFPVLDEYMAQPEPMWRRLELPVTVRGRVTGRLSVLRRGESPPFSAADGRLLETVSAQLAVVCERDRLHREANENEILRRSDDIKTALLHAVSHDLRTPLSAIIASAGSLLEDDVLWTPQERRDLAQSIRTGAVRLNQIVENLLDLSRIEAGILYPQKDWYDVRSLVDDVAGRLRAAAGERSVVVDVPEDMPPVLLDYVKMAQVLTNLLENAIKYTPVQSVVAVSARRTEDEAFLVVADDGPGLPEEALQRLFEPFYRGDAATGRPQGAGLGLAVAKGLVTAHGGRVWAENRPEGGARFVVSLPLSRPDAGSERHSLGYEKGGGR